MPAAPQEPTLDGEKIGLVPVLFQSVTTSAWALRGNAVAKVKAAMGYVRRMSTPLGGAVARIKTNV